MKMRLSNQLNMVGACITVANSKDYKPVWTGQPPVDFEKDMAGLDAGYANVLAKAALAEAAAGGGGDVKAAAETALEEATFVLARAMANHFKKNGDLERLAKVDVTRTAIVQLRNQDLVDKATAIRDLGADAVGEPAAVDRGVVPARVTTLTGAIGAFSKVMNVPRGQIVNRSALLREVETDVAALVEQVTDMDDLALQFDGEAGLRFQEAWRRARIIVDIGGGHNGEEQPSPTPTPATGTKTNSTPTGTTPNA